MLKRRHLAILLLWGLLANPALGQPVPDALKAAVDAPNNWYSGVVAVGQRAGIFKKHGVEPELLFTRGDGRRFDQGAVGGSDPDSASQGGAVTDTMFDTGDDLFMSFLLQ